MARKRFLAHNVAVVAIPNPLDNLQVVVVFERNGNKSLHYENDVSILFNQQRLNKLSNIHVENMIANLKKGGSDLSEFSDEELMESVTSRYFQSHADVYNLQRKIENDIEDFKKDLKDRQFAKHYYDTMYKKYLEKSEKSKKEDSKVGD